MKLIRTDFKPDGIFGRLYNDHGVPIAYSLEHAYLQPDGTWAPKLNEGDHQCIRGTHALHDLVQFETFEITEVPGHTNILFHYGNFDNDSEGCVLLGHDIKKLPNKTSMITLSRTTFAEFMQSLKDVNEFTLTVGKI